MTSARSVRKKVGLASNRTFVLLVLIAPIEAFLMFLVMFPTALEAYLSFTSWTPLMGVWWQAPLVGVANYVKLFSRDPRFLIAIGRSVFILVSCVLIEFVIGLFLANHLSKEFRGKKSLFLIFLAPMMIAPIVVGYNWYLIFLPNGPLNYVITLVTGTPYRFAWLADPTTALLGVAVSDIWHWTPLFVLILTAGFAGLPANQIDSARVLGASEWKVFRYVKLPLLIRVILVALVIRSMEILKLFDEIYIMTGGGPGYSTETISIYLYNTAVTYQQLGYAAAAAIVILLIIAAAVTRALRPLRVMVTEQEGVKKAPETEGLET